MSNPVLAHSPSPQQIKKVIKTLEQDLPDLFKTDICYDIYSHDIAFKDPVNRFNGKFNYRIIFWTLRFHAALFFTEIYFDVHQIAHPEPDIVRVDWTVRGTLRVPWSAKILFNGYSNYRLNSEGLIYDHVDTWDRSPKQILKQFWKS
ncbi:DUF2358 domain-containing protein [Spirulina subsalsa FACHB-351]|uniref:DUF2358 domain-containing protein n=1 Tax=Spirulina subsalsa FACHB-351 TaxID=234711 RepID=A0ABT3L476_9CYAN|nr:DUF2358 domain-containing protein [Spirulina subsalsa]MCW6035785.1 DUF2358 domain-containing protein [Spirulina subsalsa FACHB-351]